MLRDAYRTLDATALAAAVRAGDTDAFELQGLARAEAAQSQSLNALVELFAAPLAASAEPTAPFTGVPFVLKDVGIAAAGVRCELGSALAAGRSADRDSALMERFRAAGLVGMGRSAVPEFAFSLTTEPLVHGAVRHPLDPALSPGGSSGGAAVAVAAGIVPLAHANDAAGSIRVPAALCGLVGLKPSRSRVPSGPQTFEAMGGLSCEFALTRSLRDAAALLDAVAGPVPGDPYVIAPPPEPYVDTVRRAIWDQTPRLRIGVIESGFDGSPVSPTIAATITRAADSLADAGHDLRRLSLPLRVDALRRVERTLWLASIAQNVHAIARATGRPIDGDFLEPATLVLVEAGERLTAVEVMHAFATRNHLCRDVALGMADCDVLLLPTVPDNRLPLGSLDTADGCVDSWYERQSRWTAFVSLANLTGQPALHVPQGLDATGLPVGVQLMAAAGEEGLLLALGAELEALAGAGDCAIP